MMFFNLCLALLWLAGVSAGEPGTKSVLTTHSIRGPSVKPEGHIQQQYTGFQPGESSVVLHQEVPPSSLAQQDAHDQRVLQVNPNSQVVGQQDARDQRVPQVGAQTVGHTGVPNGGPVAQQQQQQYPFFVYQPVQQTPYYYPQQGQQQQQQPYFAPQQDQYFGQSYGPVFQQGQQQPYFAPQQDQYYGQNFGPVPQKGQQQQPFYVAQHIPQQQQGPYYGQYGQYGHSGSVAAPVQSTRYVQIVPYVNQGSRSNRPQIVEVDAITVPIQFLFRSASGQLQLQPVHPSQQQQQQVQRTRLEGQTQVGGHEVNKPVPYRRTSQEEVHPIVPKGERLSAVAGTGSEEPIQSSQALTSTSSVTNSGGQVSPQSSGQIVDGRVPY